MALTITGTHVTATPGDLAVTPFSGVTITDPGATAETLTIAPSPDANGVLSGPGLSADVSGVYTLTAATAAAMTTALDALTFTPATGAPGSVTTTTFTLTGTSDVSPTPVINAATTVTDTDAVAPTITGAVAGQTTIAEAPINPFSGVTVGDLNAGATDTLIIFPSGGGTTGTLSGAGLSSGPPGGFTLSGTTAAAITSELNALTFTPFAGAPGSVTTTTFALADQSSGFPTPTSDDTTTVTDTDAVTPTITGAHTTSTTANTPVAPFTA